MNVRDISAMDKAMKRAELRAEWARRARTDPIAFIEFITRTEKVNPKTGRQERIRLADMQCEMVEFCLKHRRGVIKASPKVGKSQIITIGLTLWIAGKDTAAFRCAIGSLKQDFAMFFTSAIMEHVESNEDLHLVFPHMKPAEGKWSKEKLYLDRGDARVVHPTWRAVGATTGQQGTRVVVNVLDDIQDQESTETEALSDKTLRWIYAGESRMDKLSGDLDLSNYSFGNRRFDELYEDEAEDEWTDFGESCEPLRGDINKRAGYRWVITNALRSYDAAHKLVSDDGWPLLEAAVRDAKGRTRLPQVYTQADIDNYSKVNASRDLDCKTRVEGEQLFHEAWIQAAKKLGRGLALRYRLSLPEIEFIRNNGGRIICGVDLASRKFKKSDHTIFFVMLIAPRAFYRRWFMSERHDDIESLLPPTAEMMMPLWIERRKMHSPEIRQCLYDINDRFRPTFVVENNGCFPAGTQVLTQHGYRDIVSIEPGDVVLTHLGRWRRVVRCTTRLHLGELVTIRASGSLPIRTTPNHGFWSKSSGRVKGGRGAPDVGKHRPVGEPAWIASGDLSAGANGEAHYVSEPTPRWPERMAEIEVRKRDATRSVAITEDLAIAIGLYLAEGHSTHAQVAFTLHSQETHLREFVVNVLGSVFTARSLERAMSERCVRVTFNSVELARALKACGTSDRKAMPWDWMGWPLSTRIAVVRGWMMGDASLLYNNGKVSSLVGSTISRNLALQIQSTLAEAGLRPTIAPSIAPSKRRASVIDGRVVKSRDGFRISLNRDDAAQLMTFCNTGVERTHWRRTIDNSSRLSGSRRINDGTCVWSKLGGVSREPWNGQVYNLEVEDDHSYVVEGVAVHNSQDYVRQDIIVERRDIQIRPFHTGPLKNDPEQGVQGGMCNDLSAGLIIVPSMPLETSLDTLVCEPEVERWLAEMREFTRGAHTGDSLMASWFIREHVFSTPGFSHQVDVAGDAVTDDELMALGFDEEEIREAKPVELLELEEQARLEMVEASKKETAEERQRRTLDAETKKQMAKDQQTMRGLIKRTTQSVIEEEESDDPEVQAFIRDFF